MIGWVGSHDMRVSADNAAAEMLMEEPRLYSTLESASTPAKTISQNWEHPPIKHSTFKNGEVTCSAYGGPSPEKDDSDYDKGPGERKNPIDEPAKYYAVELDAISQQFTWSFRWLEKIEVYTAKDGSHRWRLKASNGEIVATSEGYTTRQSAKTSVQNLESWTKGAQIVEIN